jgi:autotransporter strand-loop-strand O-heptosyltransferase
MKKIVNITPGILPIPPNGWGAVEKIIWEYHQNLLKLGHDSRILYLDETPTDTDIVHIHVANLALMARDRGIPYYFTCHDHHAYINGKDSWVYTENLEAMKYSVKSFVPARYLVEYFDGIPQYFSHGVNTEYFTPAVRTEHKLLCVANNGYAYDQSIDRKGFGIAIEVAKQLNLPITIAGPSNNKNYFTKYPPSYDKLNIVYDLNEEQLLTLYKEHSIFLHPSELEAGHPNLTLLEALSCGLPVVGTLEKDTSLDGMVTVARNISDMVKGVRKVLTNYDLHSQLARNQAQKLDWYERTNELLSTYNLYPMNMKNQLLNHYNFTVKNVKQAPIHINSNNIDGIYVELAGGNNKTEYDVKFIDKSTNNVIYSVDLKRNHWGRTNIKYYVDWKITVQNKDTKEIITKEFSLENGRVYIALDSKSLGDTLAWFPYVEEFRKKHNCKVICSTFWNDLFKDNYPNIEFVSPGTTVYDLSAMYTIGLFYDDNSYDRNKHPKNPIEIPLQQIATDILGLEFKEIRPIITTPEIHNNDSKQICIAIHSTAQSKYWNNPFGWQTVVNWLKERGYTVKLLSQEEDGYMGNKNPIGVETLPKSSIDNVINELVQSKAFIGISSGLSWLSWAANVPTVIISGFTDPITEMNDCVRISAPKGKCSGCWSRHRFNPGDWNWCPDHKGTPRQFECSREITPHTVIEHLKRIL